MNKLSKQKRDHLILIAFGTIGVLIGLWFWPISPQKQQIAKIQKATGELNEKIEKAQTTLKRAEEIEDELAMLTEQLDIIEKGMVVSGSDSYSWILDIFNRFILNRPLANFTSSGENLGEIMIVPRFPYRAATFRIHLTGYYHDLGRFLADLENTYPFFRIQAVEISPTTTPGDRERLDMKFEFVTLVKRPDHP